MNMKDKFIEMFLADTVTDLRYSSINLDVTDMGIGDILRNVDTYYPVNRSARNAIVEGRTAVCVKCLSELLDPMSGLILLITNGENNANNIIVSKNYIVAVIDEERIRTTEGITDLMKDLSKYMIKEFKDSLRDFTSFFIKFIYDTDSDS